MLKITGIKIAMLIISNIGHVVSPECANVNAVRVVHLAPDLGHFAEQYVDNVAISCCDVANGQTNQLAQ